MRLAVVGLGKLGCPFAALLAAKGHDVLGADLNPRFAELVDRGEPPVEETDLPSLMRDATARLRATTDVEAAGAQADIVFVVVPTPSLPDATFDTSYAVAAFAAIGAGFRRNPDRRQVAVLTRTVLPGATEGPIRAALEHASGEPVGDRIGLCYSPEFIALGSVIADLREPDLILVGQSSDWAGGLVGGVLQEMTDNKAEVRRMSIVNAEITKIAVNTFVKTKISYANMLAEICERLPGADAAVVAASVGLDSRIGRAYLHPATAYGGPCFPRDNAALAALARQIGVTADIAEATNAVNRRQVDNLGQKIAKAVQPHETVGVLGLSYKPGTNVSDESFGVHLSSWIADRGIAVVAYDPSGVPGAARQLGDSVRLESAAAHVLDQSHVLVLATPWPEFANIESGLIAHNQIHDVFDCWRQLPQTLSTGARVWHIGLASDPGAQSAAT
jgi:UDPglucose 6-dehydrogenase